MTNYAGSGGVEETGDHLVDELVYCSMSKLMEEIEEVLEYTSGSQSELEFYMSDGAL